ncbi:MAG TPA: FGGY-family carbohydrate kinase [Microlunatus sp.]
MTVRDLFLGVDIGSGSTKGVLATAAGEIVGTAVRQHSMSLPRPGWAEFDPETVWWDEVVSICAELVGTAGAESVRGVCVSGVGPCLVLCDDDLKPVRPAILYGIDMRATAEIDELTERYGAEAIIERGGKALSSQAVGPKMLWVQRNEPQVWERATGWYNSNSYIAARLTGEYVLDHHTASQCDPLYDIKAADWSTDWAAEIAGGLPLPRLCWPGEQVGTVTAAASAATGLRVGTPVMAGTVDAWAEAFSAGVRHPGDLMLMYGSTMFFVQVLQQLRVHPLLWTTSGVEPGSITLAAGMATSGSITGWLRDLTGGVPFETLMAEAAEVPPGSDGLLLLPYFAGERTPIFDPDARGVVAGLTLRHRRGHLMRAVYEGIAFGIRQILEFIEDDTDPTRRLVAVGGGTQGGLWTQIVSDVCDRPQQLPESTIGASYGDALLAAIGTGAVDSSTDWATVERVVEPDPGTREVYDQLYRGYSDLYPATRPQMHLLAQVQQSRFATESQPS